MPGYQCGACDGAEPAVVLITPLSGAETLAVGNNCLPVTWCGMFAGVTGLNPEQLWDAAVALAQATADMEAQADGEPDGAEAVGTEAGGQPAQPDVPLVDSFTGERTTLAKEQARAKTTRPRRPRQ